MKTRNYHARYIDNNSGSTILTVMIVILILSIISMGLLNAVVNNITMSKEVDNFERTFYSGESAVVLGIETLKKETASYYNQMATYRSSPTGLNDYMSMYMDFFSNIHENAIMDFIEPQLTKYKYGNPETSTSFETPVMLSSNSALFTVHTVTTDSGIKRTLSGSIIINRIDLTPIGAPSFPYYGNEALIAGGTLDTGMNNGYNVYGNARVGALITNKKKPWQFTAYNEETCVDPNVIEDINWNLDFDTILSNLPTIPDATPSIPAVPNNVTINTKYVQNNGGTFSNPLNLIGQPGASFNVKSISYPGGVIYSDGNLSVTNGSYTSGNIYIYCQGNLNVSSVSLSNFVIYCGGNLNADNGSFGSGEIYCAGNVIMNSAGTINCNVYAGGDITIYGGSFGQNMFCGGIFNCGGLSINRGLVYAEAGINLGYNNRGGTITGVLYTNGDAYYERGVEITGGQLVAKGDIILNPSKSMWTSVSYNAGIVVSLLDETRLNNAHLIGTNGNGGSVELPTSQVVFGEEHIG